MFKCLLKVIFSQGKSSRNSWESYSIEIEKSRVIQRKVREKENDLICVLMDDTK